MNEESSARTLLVFAHRDEASAFADVPHLVTGVGKANAAGALAHALAVGCGAASRAAGSAVLDAIGAVSQGVSSGAATRAPHSCGPGIERVIVLGTAGLISDADEAPSLDTVCQVTAAVQHDLSLPSPRLVFRGEEILPVEETAVIATGDVFVSDDAQRARIADIGASLVDMETYAYASVCERFGVELQVFKVPSDFADSSTTDEEWDTVVFRKSEQLRAFWDVRFDSH